MITVLQDRRQWKIQLYGIDCPELKGQPFGAKAKEFTGKLAFGQTVSI